MGALANPSPVASDPLPAMAHVVSGRHYVFDPNDLDFHAFSLSFAAGTDEALLDFSYRDRNLVQIPVGLDNVPRVTMAEGYLRVYEGTWLSGDTFFMSYQIVGYSENGTFNPPPRFKPNRLLLELTANCSPPRG